MSLSNKTNYPISFLDIETNELCFNMSLEYKNAAQYIETNELCCHE